MCNVIQGKVRSYMQRNQKTRKSAVEGGGWDVLFISEDGSHVTVLLGILHNNQLIQDRHRHNFFFYFWYFLISTFVFFCIELRMRRCSFLEKSFFLGKNFSVRECSGFLSFIDLIKILFALFAMFNSTTIRAC